MKKHFSLKAFYPALIVLILSSKCYSQGEPPVIFNLDSLPFAGIKLVDGWQFFPGDTPPWRDTIDKRIWQPVMPSVELHKLPHVREAGIGWFRFKLKVDSSLLNERIAMVYTSMGASEIYLNGELLYQFGKVSSDYKTEKTRLISYRPLSLKLGNQPLQELAVRYSFHRRNLYLNLSNTKCIQIILKDNNKAFADYLRFEGFYQNLRSIQLTFYLPLGFLLLFLYYSYRLKKEYLYFGVFCCSMFLSMLMMILGRYETRTVNEANSFFLAQQIISTIGMIALLKGSYPLFHQPKSWAYPFSVAFALLFIGSVFVFYDWTTSIGNVFTIIVNIEFMRLSVQALVKRRPGSIILVLLGLVCFLLTAASLWLGFTELGYFLLSIRFILPAIGFSLFFAGEFARTGWSLQQRLGEVERLSDQAILQEKEKQQLLSLQTEMLEKQVEEKTNELMQQQLDLEAEKEAKLTAEFNRRFSESELKALRAQMNPHFIFNALNSIDNLIQTDQKERATNYLAKFARLVRAILENSKQGVIPCWKDLETLRLYIELENLRWDEQFTTEMEVDERIMHGDYKVPPMLVQPYVENAIHHGLLNKPGNDRKLHISVKPENGYIKFVVEDNGIGRVQAEAYNKSNRLRHKSMAMEITEQRIQLFNQSKNGSVKINDLFNDDLSSAGTRVEILINNQG